MQILMNQLIPLLLQAFTLGSFYTLIALGFALIFGVTNVLNIAHGEFIILSGYVAYYTERVLGLGFWLTLPFCIIISTLVCFCLIFVTPKNNHEGELRSLIITFGIALVLQNVYLGLFSADYRIIFHNQKFFHLLHSKLVIGSLQILLIFLSLGTVLLLFVFARKTFVGKAFRATIQDRYTARLLGIPIKKMQYLALLLGGIAIGLSGPLYARISYVHPFGGIEPTLTAMVITLFAGKGHIRGLLYGGWILGCVETLSSYFLGTEWKELFGALFLIGILIWKYDQIYEKQHA